MKIIATKSKEMCISFNKSDCTFPILQIVNEELERVNSIRLVGVRIQNNLKRDHHVENITKKANKKLFFLKQLKRSGVPESDLLRSQLKYAIPAWSTSITKDQCDQLERIQKKEP